MDDQRWAEQSPYPRSRDDQQRHGWSASRQDWTITYSRRVLWEAAGRNHIRIGINPDSNPNNGSSLPEAVGENRARLGMINKRMWHHNGLTNLMEGGQIQCIRRAGQAHRSRSPAQHHAVVRPEGRTPPPQQPVMQPQRLRSWTETLIKTTQTNNLTPNTPKTHTKD